MAQLNTATSIVDFLKTKGFTPQGGDRFPLYTQRKQIFEGLGLNSSLGDFIGSSAQNTALLNSLQKKEQSLGVSLSPNNLLNFIQGGGAAPATTPYPSPPPPPVASPGLRPGPESEPTTGLSTPSTEPLDQQSLDQIFNPLEGRNVAQEALDRVTSSATYPLQQEEQSAQKAAVELGAQRETENFIKNIASRGLFFSGAKNKGVQTIEADKLSELLGIDRKFALLMTQGIENATQDIVKQAQKGSEDALSALKALGYTINPLSGRLEPTLEAKRAAQSAYEYERTAARLEDAATAKQELDQAKYELSVAKSQAAIEQAQQRIELATARYELAVSRSGNDQQRNDDVETYAQDVFSGSLKLTGVPSKIRAAVSNRVKELSASQYDTEFEARVDYDQEVQALQQAKNDGTLAGKPSEIITALINTYGSKVSRQEIEGTIYNLFGIKK